MNSDFLVTEYDDYYNETISMSYIGGIRHIRGIVAAHDGLSVVFDPKDRHLVDHIQTNKTKLHRVSDHAVIGFVGEGLKVYRLEEYAEDISKAVAGLKYPFSLKDIADEVFRYLSKKFTNGEMASILIAGYGYDEKGRPTDEPGFYRCYFDKNIQSIDEEPLLLSAARDDHREALRLGYEEAEKNGLVLPLKSRVHAAKILEDDIRVRAKTDKSIAGYIRIWDITRGGITERFLSHPIEPQVKPGDRVA